MRHIAKLSLIAHIKALPLASQSSEMTSGPTWMVMMVDLGKFALTLRTTK